MIVRYDLISSYVRESCKINATIKVLIFPFDLDLNISRMCVHIFIKEFFEMCNYYSDKTTHKSMNVIIFQ